MQGEKKKDTPLFYTSTMYEMVLEILPIIKMNE